MIGKYDISSRYVIKHTQNHLYIAPHALLRPYIAHYTVSFPAPSIVPDTLTIIPDASGCLVFTLNCHTLSSLLWGATTTVVVLENDVNSCPMRLFVEFLPGGLFFFTGVGQADLTDSMLPLEQINEHLYLLIAEALEKASSLDNFFEMLNCILLGLLMKRQLPRPIQWAVQRLKLSRGTMSIKELARLLNYSERHTNRLFNDYVGMSAKTLSRIIRINTSIKKMKKAKVILSALALETGYYDQSHFIHDFTSVCGVTPKAYLASIPNFYNEPLKF